MNTLNFAIPATTHLKMSVSCESCFLPADAQEYMIFLKCLC